MDTTATTPREGRRILVVGGGYAGLYVAWRLEKRLRRGEVVITVVDQHGYMTYQPFLPEVSAGSVGAKHSAVSLRSHLSGTRVVAAHVTGIQHDHRAAHVRTPDGSDHRLPYDVLVLTAGDQDLIVPPRRPEGGDDYRTRTPAHQPAAATGARPPAERSTP